MLLTALMCRHCSAPSLCGAKSWFLDLCWTHCFNFDQLYSLEKVCYLTNCSHCLTLSCRQGKTCPAQHLFPPFPVTRVTAKENIWQKSNSKTNTKEEKMRVSPNPTWSKSSPMTSLTSGAAVVMSVNSGSEHALVAVSMRSVNPEPKKQQCGSVNSGPK